MEDYQAQFSEAPNWAQLWNPEWRDIVIKSNRLIVTQLLPDSVYWVRVRARNAVGVSDYSPAFEVGTSSKSMIRSLTKDERSFSMYRPVSKEYQQMIADQTPDKKSSKDSKKSKDSVGSEDYDGTAAALEKSGSKDGEVQLPLLVWVHTEDPEVGGSRSSRSRSGAVRPGGVGAHRGRSRFRKQVLVVEKRCGQ